MARARSAERSLKSSSDCEKLRRSGAEKLCNKSLIGGSAAMELPNASMSRAFALPSVMRPMSRSIS